MCKEIKESKIPEHILNKLHSATKWTSCTPQKIHFKEYAEYKMEYWECKGENIFQFFVRTRQPNLFLDNLWTEVCQRNNQDHDIMYVTDWSILDPVTPPILRTLTPKEQYAITVEEETTECGQFYDWCLAKSMLTEEDALEFKIKELVLNRMIMGSFRYGKIKDKDYLNYDLASSIELRKRLAFATNTYEPFIDSFNMLFLLYLKYPNRLEEILSQGANMLDNIMVAITGDWPLGASDDGIHSEKAEASDV